MPGFSCSSGASGMIWREVLRVTIPGAPVPKGRPRFGKGKTYTDKKTRAYEKLIALCVSSSPMLRDKPRPLCGDGPVRVDIVAVFPRPQRLQARRHSDNLIPMGCRPDLVNVLKACLDGALPAPCSGTCVNRLPSFASK